MQELSEWGKLKNISFVDIYWRERICQTLNGAEGLAIRYQYLGIHLSEAEQASFFSRFGSELEQLVRGGFDSIERKIDHLAFTHWKTGDIRDIEAELEFHEAENSRRDAVEHFRVMVRISNNTIRKRVYF